MYRGVHGSGTGMNQYLVKKKSTPKGFQILPDSRKHGTNNIIINNNQICPNKYISIAENNLATSSKN